MLITGLPLLDPFYRVDQHHNVQEQAVPDPQEQHYLHRDEQRQSDRPNPRYRADTNPKPHIAMSPSELTIVPPR